MPADRLLEAYQSEGMKSALNMFLSDKQTLSLWSSQVQQLIAFGYKVIGANGSGEDIYRACRFATEQYPDAPEVWYHLGSVYAFSGRWEEATSAYRAAYNLRLTNYLIRRMCIRRRRESEWSAECGAGCVGERHAQRGQSRAWSHWFFNQQISQSTNQSMIINVQQYIP